jgi:hypothetical protein
MIVAWQGKGQLPIDLDGYFEFGERPLRLADFRGARFPLFRT